MEMKKSNHLWKEEDHPRDELGRFCKSNKLYEETVDKIEKVDILLDKATNCLERCSDGKIIETYFEEITPKKAQFKEWQFDWTLPKKQGCSVYALKAEGDDRVQGLIALKAVYESTNAIFVQLAESAPFNNSNNKKYFVKKEYEGVGHHLFAEAVKQSFEHGFGGIVYFNAKTKLISYYTKMGAELTDYTTGLMILSGRKAYELYEKYYGNK